MIVRLTVTHEIKSSPQAAIPPKSSVFLVRRERGIIVVSFRGGWFVRGRKSTGDPMSIGKNDAIGCASVGH